MVREKDLVVREDGVELPGLDETDIELTLSDGALMLEGEKKGELVDLVEAAVIASQRARRPRVVTSRVRQRGASASMAASVSSADVPSGLKFASRNSSVSPACA